jgi:NADPH:quinone reductase-like Zn-dependent oxidoreductase
MAGTAATEPDATTTGAGGGGGTMRAIGRSRYGGPEVLELATVERPTPAADEVLIAVRAASVNAGDRHLMRGSPFLVRLIYGGIMRPKSGPLGVDVAGRVEAVGEDVTRFEPGDEVFGDLSTSGFGAFAEYVCAPEDVLASKPAGVPFADAAAVPTAAVAALQALRDEGGIRAGERVLVNGASGGVGTFTVQLAKWFGAEVTGVCSTAKVDLVRSLGADHVVDYTREDFTESGRRYDLIVDAAASHSLSAYRRTLRPAGRYVMVGGPTSRFVRTVVFGPLLSMTGTKRLTNLMLRTNPADLAFVGERLAAGNIAPLIDREYGLADVPEAIRYLEAGRATGKVVITVGGTGEGGHRDLAAVAASDRSATRAV